MGNDSSKRLGIPNKAAILSKDLCLSICDQSMLCLQCKGIVIKPVECKNCDTLYCTHCKDKLYGKKCLSCKSSSYGAVNRIVMNAINKLQLKCMNKECKEQISYERYENHL